MRRFEFVDGNSSKFWMPEVQGATFIVTYGRIGTAGQRKEKAFPDEEAALREYTKKVAEKVREGYAEVGAGEAPAAPPPKVAVAAAPPKLVLPRRVAPAMPGPELVSAAGAALSSLQARLKGPSWKVTRLARKARHALRALGGVDPAAHPALAAPFAALMAHVVGPKAEGRLPVRHALGLLSAVDVAAFQRATEMWKAAPAGSVPTGVAAARTLGDPELALRVTALLAERPDLRDGSEDAWTKRWSVLKPHVEAHLGGAGSSLSAFIGGVDAGGDAHLSKRLARLGA
ncbi:WGR domain-containing protein [Corallococcus sp. CA047B]|uniref:WGR domain-containing protein n=1 Tax=Corallococcus sp. CA047B TaxID=2316729 RepID=UPI000EA1AF69|nr:WGR domain-containing protein [Corallococcus sp. CA047B]RKH18359.1 WGR domain-containing protein [Corallococcus sp. CA047B]